MPKAPSRTLFALEPFRAGREFVWHVAHPRLRRVEPGDGHPVLVLPGFTGSDLSTRPMRAFLRRLDYHVHAWKLGRNWGPTDRILDGLAARFIEVSERHDRKISLIGHSLGGVYARELARRAPDRVRQVITLGSPLRWTRGSTSNVTPLYQAVSSRHSERVKDVRPPEGFEHAPEDVPFTAIFSRTDGVVGWRNTVCDCGPLRECIEVRGSHSGLVHNVATLLVVADRLAQPEGEWARFRERRGVDATIFTDATTVD